MPTPICASPASIASLVSWFISKIDNHGAHAKLIVPVSKISHLQEVFKDNRKTCSNFSALIASFGSDQADLRKSPAALREMEKQCASAKGLQPTTLTECFLCQTLADIFGLEMFADIDKPTAPVPTWIMSTFLAVKASEPIGTNPRYVYYSASPSNQLVLAQTGNPQTVDAFFVRANIGIRLEIKQVPARLEELDIGQFDESGKIVPDQRFLKKAPFYKTFVDNFNAATDVFSTGGSNVPLLDPRIGNVSQVATTALTAIGNKFIDLFLFAKGNEIIPVMPSDFSTSVIFDGSEIRPVGRNPHKVFSPLHLSATLTSIGAVIYDGNFPGLAGATKLVKVPTANISAITGRNVGEKTRIGFGRFYSVRKGWFIQDGDFTIFPLKKVIEPKPSISIHIDI